MAPRRPKHLKGVMNGNQRARQDRRHGEFDDHHPVQGRSGKNDDGTEASLNQAQTDDTKPGENGMLHAHPAWIAASANALMSMPTT